MKKTISLCLLLVVILSVFSGCADTNDKALEVPYIVSIVDAEGTEILYDAGTLVKNSPKASDALQEACRNQKLVYTNSNGLYDGFGGIKSTTENGWLFYFNGDLASQGIEDVLLLENQQNVIEFRYENYSEAFTLQ